MLDELEFDRMKCYSMDDCSDEELNAYFQLLYKSCTEYYVIERNSDDPIPTVPQKVPVAVTVADPVSETGSLERPKMTIITPCIRPENLIKIKGSIRFDYIDQWIIVYDGKKVTEHPNVFGNEENSKIKEYIYTGEGRSSNPQRNYGIGQVEDKHTYLYFLDDDNIVHPDLYDLLDTAEYGKIYTFNQDRPKDVFPFVTCLLGDTIELRKIDTAMFLIDYQLCKYVRWVPDKYNADGIYAMECYSTNRDKWIYVNRTLAYYNSIIPMNI
jgi:hypothetical protein